MTVAVSAAVLPFLPAPTAAAAAVPPVPSPATVLTVFPWEGSMEDELQGKLCQSPNNCVQIRQFLWDPNGIATIEATIDATPGTKVVFSYSEGARSVADWLEEHAGDPDAPSPDELSFVLIGNPTRAYGGSDNKVMPQTQYQVVDIARQYDPASDFPDNPLNLVALLNSLAAFTVIHTDYEGVDMYDPANIVWKEGNTTYVFVPTENLPLLQPLRNLGLGGLADALNGPLKEIVERAYDRSYLPTAEEEPASEPTPAPSPESVAAAREVDSEPGPAEVDRADSTVMETRSVASSSEVISEPPETDGTDIDTDGAVASGDGAKDTNAEDPQEDSLDTSDDIDVDLDVEDTEAADGADNSEDVDAEENAPETSDDERPDRTSGGAGVTADAGSDDSASAGDSPSDGDA